jgi:thiosulfate reductase cytochrome b subunit
VTKPDSYWDVVVAHLPIALLTGLGLVLPFLGFP